MSKQKTKEEFLFQLREELLRTGELDRYDLSKIDYVNATTKVTMTCMVHGDWSISPNHLLNGRRCPECKLLNLRNLFTLGGSTFIQRSIELYGDKYTYEKTNYVNNHTAVIITCSTHGDLQVIPSKWLKFGHGCKYCHRDSFIPHNKRTLKSYIEEATEVNSTTPETYSLITEYSGCKVKHPHVCLVHGIYYVTPDNHINAGSSCPKCSNKISRAEQELKDFIDSLGLKYLGNEALLDGKHIDVFIPEKNIGIEYHGLYYHGELQNTDRKYHLNKYLLAKEKGIQLIQVFEDEWKHRQDLVKNSLQIKLGIPTTTLYARKLDIGVISKVEANNFYDKTHLQGHTGSIEVSVGLLSRGSLVACMSFSRANAKEGTELVRFASIGRVTGGFSKLLKWYIKTYQPEKVISFSDNRWSNGGVYSSNGFKECYISGPRYWWCYGYNRWHRRNFQRQYLPKVLKVFDETLSESSNCRNNGYFKIWDAGVTKWEFVRKIKNPGF